MAITAPELIAHMGITQNLGSVEDVVDAVNEYVNSLPTVHRAFAKMFPEDTSTDPDYDSAWGPTHHLAALMLGSRWYRRRNSPNGIESSIGETTVYVTKYDSDIARLLEIDGFEKPDVG